MTVSVHASAPDEIKLKVCAEATLGEWRGIVDRIMAADGPRYYSPLHDLMGLILQGIKAIEKREEIAPQQAQGANS